MDLRQALTEEMEYAVNFRGFILYFTLRNPTNQEDIGYRRRSGKVSIKNKNIETSDTALDAPLWLLEQIKTKVEYSNGKIDPATGEVAREPVPDDLYREIPARTKQAVISRHLADLEGEEAEQQKNS